MRGRGLDEPPRQMLAPPSGRAGLEGLLAPRTGRKSGGKCSLQLRWPQDTLGGSWEMHSVQAGSARQAVLGQEQLSWSGAEAGV